MLRMLFIVQLATFLCFQTDVGARADTDSTACVSEWFEVNSFAGGPSPKQILDLCEETRAELFRVWVEPSEAMSWKPRCKINIHPTRAHYLRKVGSGAGQTSGCSSIQLHEGKIVLREIDLLLDHTGELTALPHELTHVVLADLLRGRQPPHWLDEGIAMLADTEAKQRLHQRDCNEAISSGNAMSIHQIVNLHSFTSPNQMPAFYGQSLSLICMLSERAEPSKVIAFANDSLDHGLDEALKKHYAIESIEQLEKAWRAYVFKKPAADIQVSVVSVRFKP